MTELLRNFSALCLNQPVKTLFLGRARSSVTSPPGSHVARLCWSMTCKYQTLALVTSPNTAHLRADASGKCLSSPQYVQCRLQADGKTPSRPHLTHLYAGLCLLKPNERCQPAFLLSWPLPMLCACVRLTRPSIQMLV